MQENLLHKHLFIGVLFFMDMKTIVLKLLKYGFGNQDRRAGIQRESAFSVIRGN